MVAHTKSEQYFDISFICKDCKLEYDNNVLPRCEKCDRLMRNKSLCYCHKEKKKQTQSLTNRELVAQSFSSRLENKTRELEKELSITKEELKIEREVWIYDIRDGISKSLGIYLTIQRYIQEIYTIEIINNVTFHVGDSFVVR